MKELETIAKNMKTQDNRATASPYYFEVQTFRAIGVVDPDYSFGEDSEVRLEEVPDDYGDYRELRGPQDDR